MKRVYFLVFTFLLIEFASFGQNVYISIAAGGNWNSASTWDIDFDGIGGDGIPAANDIVIIQGDNAGGGAVLVNANVAVGDVLVQYDNPNVLGKGGLSFITYTLTINGQLAGFDWYGTQNYAPPTTNVVANSSTTRLQLNFTGDAIVAGTSFNPAIFSWSHNAPLKSVTFVPASSATNLEIEDLSINASSLIVSNGTLTVNSGYSIVQNGASTMTIASGANLVINGAINGDGTNTSRYGTITNNGTITSGVNGYFNSEVVNLGAGSNVTVNFNGVNQTEGWWYQSTSPIGAGTVDATSTVNFAANVAQGVGAFTYGNLSLSGGGTKTLSSSNTLYVNGDLNVVGAGVTFSTSSNPNPIDIGGDLHNDGTWAPTQLVNMTGSVAQVITGNNLVTFGGGLTMSNTSGVSLLNQDIDINGPLTIDASVNFNPNGRQVNLSGNLVNSGSLSASGTFVFDGTTTVSGTGTNSFENVTISGSVSAQAKSVTLSGNFINNGSIDNLNGTVDFNGNTNQDISGSGTTNFYNLTVSNSSATVSNSGTSNLVTSMTMGAGSTFDADGAGAGVFTLLSTSGSNAARINAIPSDALVSGNLVVQRYFDGAGDVWRNFGVCVNGATLTDITNSGFTFNLTGNDMAYYNETATGSVDNGWVLKSSFGSSNLATNFGYSMWTRAAETPTTVNFNGALLQQTQSIPITYTNSGSAVDDGWNLINNPFPSTVDWDLMTKNGSVSGTVAVWNTSTAGYDYWNGSTGNLTNGLIASGQAFWVQTNAAGPTLSIPESAKVTSNTSFLRTNDEPAQNVLIVAVEQNGNIDKTYVHFRDDATDNFDTQLDGRKLSNVIFNLSTLSASGDALAINSLPMGSCSKSISLNLTNVAVGTYNLELSNYASFAGSYVFTLTDNFLSSSKIMSLGDIYSFDVTADPASYGSTRFTVEVTTAGINPTVEYQETNVCDPSSNLLITNAQVGATYTLLNGGNVVTSIVASSSSIYVPLTDQQLSDGVNVFDVKVDMGTCSTLTISNAVTVNKVPIQNISSVTDGKNCGPGRVLISASGAQGNAYYNWYESLDSANPIPGQNGNEYLTPDLETNKFYYVSISNEYGCESAERIKVLAEIVNIPVPEVVIEGDVLSTAAVADSYQWYKDGTPIDGETNQTLNVFESGSYSVEVASNGCTQLSDNAVVEILGIEDLKLSGISIYPNPVITVLNIDSDKMQIENVMIYSTNGSLIYQSDENFYGKIDMSNVKKGIYIVNIVTNNQIINYRIKKK